MPCVSIKGVFSRRPWAPADTTAAVGPDGHVASLFPNRKELAESPEQWVLPVRDSPKPPSQRITMTMDVINASGEVLLVAAGNPKDIHAFSDFAENDDLTVAIMAGADQLEMLQELGVPPGVGRRGNPKILFRVRFA